MAHFMQTLALVSVIPLSIPLGAYAHMEMSWPYAFRSKFDPAITDPDYDNTFPLSSNGSNYPCKGYQNLASSQVSKVIYTPGQTYNITLAGSATHIGGSCQISLSYDNGQSFKVIKSMIGGCPLKDDWDFTVPGNAPPSDEAILAWTWFNIVGNREMYMNCARVTVAGQSVQRYRRYQTRRQNSLDALPDNFACDIGNGCTTIERREVVFPNPGPVIEENADMITPDPGPGFTLVSTPTGGAFSTVPPNATATSASYPILESTTTMTMYFESTGTGYLSTTYFNSTSLLTVNSKNTFSTSSFTLTTTTTPRASPGFFYTVNGTFVSSSSTSSTGFRTSAISSFSTDTATTPSLLMLSSAIIPSTTSSIAASNTTTSSPIIATLTLSTSSADRTSLTTTSSTSSASTMSSLASNAISTSTISLTALSTASSTTPSTISAMTLSTTLVTTTTSTTSPSTIVTIIPTFCTPGSFTCDSITTFSQCVPNGSGSGTYVFMGFVAPGTQCVGGSLVRQNAGHCTPNGSLQCDGETAFYICDHGGLINMGSVAPGTICRDGVIGFA